VDRRSIFEKVKTHLLAQNCKAIDSLGCCVHMTDAGMRCAIGCLIPDNHPGIPYTGGVDALLCSYSNLRILWGVESDDDEVFLMRLQDIHDDYDPTDWEIELDVFEMRKL